MRTASTHRHRDTLVLSLVTYLRVLLIPVVMALVLVGDRVAHAYVAAAVLFSVAALTDFVDGYLARRWKAASSLGSFLDTTADKLLVSGVLVALVAVGRASPWVAAIVVGRELAVLGLRGAAAEGGTVFKPSIWGKMKATAQFVAIVMAILRVAHRLGPLYPDEYAMIAVAVITVMSGAEYFVRFSTFLSRR